jgi:F-type H+-transporting ATPase subunit alpha
MPITSVDKMKKWEGDLLRYLATSQPELGRDISQNKRITEETEVKLRQALASFQASWQ